MADILNGMQSIHSPKKWMVASDFDDKQLGYDLVCINWDEAKIGVVDMTFNTEQTYMKLEKLQEFIDPTYESPADIECRINRKRNRRSKLLSEGNLTGN